MPAERPRSTRAAMPSARSREAITSPLGRRSERPPRPRSSRSSMACTSGPHRVRLSPATATCWCWATRGPAAQCRPRRHESRRRPSRPRPARTRSHRQPSPRSRRVCESATEAPHGHTSDEIGREERPRGEPRAAEAESDQPTVWIHDRQDRERRGEGARAKAHVCKNECARQLACGAAPGHRHASRGHTERRRETDVEPDRLRPERHRAEARTPERDGIERGSERTDDEDRSGRKR